MLFIGSHRLLAVVCGLSSGGVWAQQPWCVGSAAVVCGLSSGDVWAQHGVWAQQRWCVGSAAVVCGLSSGGVSAQQLWYLGLAAPQHVGS